VTLKRNKDGSFSGVHQDARIHHTQVSGRMDCRMSVGAQLALWLPDA
jgi:hypothetical protein